MFDALPPAIAPVLRAALDAVDPARAVHAALRRSGDRLHAGDQTIDLAALRRLFVIGAGKAGAPMTRAVEELLGDRIAGGCVVVKHGHKDQAHKDQAHKDQARGAAVALREAGHPIPDAAGLEAGEAILRIAHSAGADDLVLCLLSGGGSALLEALPPPLTLDDLQRTTALLLAAGVAIQEVNAVRKHLSLVKGGQLARAVAPARLLTLVLSDVVGSPLDAIASGPTVPDSSTWQSAWEVVERSALADALPSAVVARLRAGCAGELAETPKAGDPAFARAGIQIVGDNAVAAQAAAAAAAALGWQPLILTTALEGEARDAVRFALAVGREVQRYGRPVAPPACLLFGGETTVTLGAEAGRGGRNQEMALAAALALEGRRGITLVALATDGSDGPTDAAGGWVDGTTAARGRAAGLDPVAALRRHDAYPWLEAAGALLVTGPTRTNVNDLLFVFVDGE